MNRHTALVYTASFLVLVVASACTDKGSPPSGSSSSATAAAPAGLPDRDIALAKKLIAEGAVVIDVRTPGEVASGMLEGAKNIPINDLAQRMGEVDALTAGDKAKPIVVYCASGARSATAKKQLLARGHTQVTNAGGYRDLK